MRVLLIGDGNSVHLLNYIRIVLADLEGRHITLFDMNGNEKTNKEAYEFYHNKRIRIVSDNGLRQLLSGSLVRNIPKLRVLFYLEQLNKKIGQLGEFDYCMIHFVDSVVTRLVVKNSTLYNKIVPIFWGSDLLRNRRIGSRWYKRLFQRSYRIVFNTENMRKTFETIFGQEFAEKSEVIKFPTMSFDKIDVLKETVDLSEIRNEMGFPTDAFVVTCGRSGTESEQFEELIKTLSSCSRDVKDKCYFVFLMTYGMPRHRLHAYQLHIERLIRTYGLKGRVIRDYLAQMDMLKLVLCSDVYITTITTDAFSGIMQEHLYAGAMVIYGKWLNYYEIERSDIVAKPIDTISDVAYVLEDVLANYDSLKINLANNAELIRGISSPEAIKECWRRKVFANTQR